MNTSNNLLSRYFSFREKSGKKYPELVEGHSKNMSWYVYIAKAKTKRYYTGITTDTSKRIAKHNNGKGSQFAQQQGPFTLVYESKPFENKSEARKREAQIKKWSRIKKEKLIKGEWI